jgi:hypothetical protein
VWSLKAAQPKREHVMQALRGARSDVDMRTDTRGSPYTLLCVKNQASYPARVAQRESDLLQLGLLG